MVHYPQLYSDHTLGTLTSVLCVSLLSEFKEHVFPDCGCGKNSRGFWLNSIEMSQSEETALLPCHAFTGNDFLSSFFRKGKPLCWKVMKQSIKFEEGFHGLGENWDVS